VHAQGLTFHWWRLWISWEWRRRAQSRQSPRSAPTPSHIAPPRRRCWPYMGWSCKHLCSLAG